MLFTTLFAKPVLGFLSTSDSFVILLFFVPAVYIVYRVVAAIVSGRRHSMQTQDYIQGRDQQTQLLTEILAELKKLNQK